MRHLLRPWWLLWLALPLGVGWAQPRFDARTLSLPQNLLSNPSFEAVTNGRPLGFELYSAPEALTLSSAEALHGGQSLLVDLPTGSSLEAAARQDVPVTLGHTYELSAWVKIAEDRGGEARLVLQMRSIEGRLLVQGQALARGTEGGWRQLAVRLKAPAGTALVTAVAPSVVGGMKVYYDALALVAVGGARGAPAGSLAQRVQATRTEATWLTLQWAGPSGTYEVSYRQRGAPRDRWVACEPVVGHTYSVVGLHPQTVYDFRVRYLWPGHYDERGQVAPPPAQPGPSPPLRVETGGWQPRVLGALRLWPPTPLASFPGGQEAPRIVSWSKSLYVVEGREGGIFLSKVQPTDFAVEWTRPLVPASTGPFRLEKVCAAAVLADHLYILVSQSSPGPPPTARVALYNCNLTEGNLEGDPLLIDAASGGGLQAYRERLWVLWSGADAQGLQRLKLAPLTDGALKEPHVWQDAPSAALRDFALGVFADELLVAFADDGMAAQRPGYAPLAVVQFNGTSFHRLRKIADLGRNGGPGGAPLGGASYLCYSTDLPWMSYGSPFRDLRLSILLPGAPGGETITYLDDMKYNASCSVTTLDNSLFVVHDKLEREPTTANAHPHSYGTFISRIDVGAPSPQAPHPFPVPLPTSRRNP